MNLQVHIDLKPLIEQGVRDILILNIGTLWEDYCFRNNVNPEIKMEGINFLADFANTINERTRENT